MKSIITQSAIFALVAAAFTFSVSQLSAQDQGRVCVLDVAEVFKRHQGFEQEMEKIRNEAAQLKSSVEQKFMAMQREAEQVEQYQIGSKERNDMETKLMTQQATLQTQARQAEADLLTREARIYFQTYRQMESVVAEIATEYGISLVLRYDSAEMKQDDRADVIKGVNRSVVYQKGLDLTNMVSQKLNAVSGNASAQAPTGSQNR